MKVIVCLFLGLAVASAFSVYETPVFPDMVDNGVDEIDGRITNGNKASAGQFPYQAGLSLKRGKDSFWCGGSVIGNSWVLTAAHCTDAVESATVYLGSTTRTVAKVSHKVSKSDIYQHSGYNSRTLANDVSLIRIPATSYTNEIQAVKLPSANAYSSYEGSYATASGWGRTSDSSSVASSLNYARLQVIANSVCSKTYGSAVITASVICVSTPNGVSTCQGDSGGPLVSDSSKVLIGVTSFVSSAGCTSGSPSGFARVSSFLPWIKSISGIQ